MQISVESDLWLSIYKNISKDENFMSRTGENWDTSLARYGVKVLRDITQRVEFLVLPTDTEELTLFLMKWS